MRREPNLLPAFREVEVCTRIFPWLVTARPLSFAPSAMLQVAQWKEQERIEDELTGREAGRLQSRAASRSNSIVHNPSASFVSRGSSRRTGSVIFDIQAEEHGSPLMGMRRSGRDSSLSVLDSLSGSARDFTQEIRGSLMSRASISEEGGGSFITRRGTGTAAGSGIIPASTGGASKKNLRMLRMRY